MEPTIRRILHLDLDAFYCAVEEQRDPGLKGRPFAVGGSPEGRGVVSSCSYAARAYGVRSAMPMRQAVRLCPDLLVVGSHFHAYRAASREVMARLRELTPLVEQISIDEAFLEVTKLPDMVKVIATRLQQRIRDELALPCSLGGATNKLVAKIATDVGKMGVQKGLSPNAITIVPPRQEAEFLAPLPVRMLWGVGPKTAEKLARAGVKSIGDLATLPERNPRYRLSNMEVELVQRARGIDTRPIVTIHESKSISQEVTFAEDSGDGVKLRATIREQAASVARRLEKKGLTARTVKIKLRWSNFETVTRQKTLAQPTHDLEVIGQAAAALFAANWTRGKPVRLIGVGVSGLEKPPKQITLWDEGWQKEQRLQEAVADLRERYGEGALKKGLGKE